MLHDGTLGWKRFFIHKVLWAVITPPLVGVSAYAYVSAEDASSDILRALYTSKALAYALTPLAVLIGLVGFVFASERTSEKQATKSAGHVILWWISLWAFAATIAILVHIASGPWTRNRGTLHMATLLTAGAFATLPALPTLKELFQRPPPPVHRGARLGVRVLCTLIAGLPIALIWWCFLIEWDNATFSVTRYIASAVFYVASAGLAILAVEILLTWWKLRSSRRNRIISTRNLADLNLAPCRCQLFKRSCTLAVSIAVPAGLAFNALVDLDSQNGFRHVSVYILLGAIVIGGLVAIAPIAHCSGQALHDVVAKTVMINDKLLQQYLHRESADESAAIESEASSDAVPEPKAENEPDAEKETESSTGCKR